MTARENLITNLQRRQTWERRESCVRLEMLFCCSIKRCACAIEKQKITFRLAMLEVRWYQSSFMAEFIWKDETCERELIPKKSVTWSARPRAHFFQLSTVFSQNLHSFKPSLHNSLNSPAMSLFNNLNEDKVKSRLSILLAPMYYLLS
jgi:hypothetical protein